MWPGGNNRTVKDATVGHTAWRVRGEPGGRGVVARLLNRHAPCLLSFSFQVHLPGMVATAAANT